MKRAIPCLVIGFAGCAAFTVGLLHVMKMGTCASGGPFLSAHPCPSDTGSWTLLLGGGIVAAVIAIIIGGWGGAGLLVWCALFLSSGIAMLAYALTGQDVSSGAKTAGYVIGATFIPLGGVPLIYLIASWIRGTEARRLRARSKQADATVSRVEELHRFGFNQAKIRVTYAVSPLDEASFEVTRETNTLLSQAPRAGQGVRVSYDPRDRHRFEVLAKNPAVAAAVLSPGGAPASALASLAAVARAASAAGIPATTGAPAISGYAPAPARDPLDRLKELAELRDSGALSTAEFESAKAKILAEG